MKKITIFLLSVLITLLFINCESTEFESVTNVNTLDVLPHVNYIMTQPIYLPEADKAYDYSFFIGDDYICNGLASGQLTSLKYGGNTIELTNSLLPNTELSADIKNAMSTNNANISRLDFFDGSSVWNVFYKNNYYTCVYEISAYAQGKTSIDDYITNIKNGGYYSIDNAVIDMSTEKEFVFPFKFNVDGAFLTSAELLKDRIDEASSAQSRLKAQQFLLGLGGGMQNMGASLQGNYSNSGNSSVNLANIIGKYADDISLFGYEPKIFKNMIELLNKNETVLYKNSATKWLLMQKHENEILVVDLTRYM